MKLKSVKCGPKDSDASPLVRLEFEQNGRTIEKSCRLSGCVKAVISDKSQLLAEARNTLMRRIREAERDFAYLEHGDDWRRHVGPFFTGPLSEDEARLISEAVGFLLL